MTLSYDPMKTTTVDKITLFREKRVRVKKIFCPQVVFHEAVNKEGIV